MRQQLDPRRLERVAQLALYRAPLIARGVRQPLDEDGDRRVIDVELLRQQLQEALSPRLIEREICPAELGRAGARRHHAAAHQERVAQLLPQLFYIVARELRPRRAAQHAARLRRNVAPRAAQRAQIAERAIDDGIEEAVAVAHRASDTNSLASWQKPVAKFSMRR